MLPHLGFLRCVKQYADSHSIDHGILATIFCVYPKMVFMGKTFRMTDKSKHHLAIVLGYAGLAPFVLLSAFLVFSANKELNSEFLLPLFEHYSALILVFLCGALWAETLIGKSLGSGKTLLIIANLVMIIVWLVSALPVFTDLTVRMAIYSSMYVALVISENRLRNFVDDSSLIDGYQTYQKMRWRLSMVVLACHLAVASFAQG